jgi:polar amino acid transport system substrate-binding protein
MNFFRSILITFCVIPSLYAAGEPLNIGIESFNPPFVMQGAHHEIYGYDIDMMNSLCKLINRTCTYKIMKFEELIPAVTNKQIDLAVSAITITKERAQRVNFSLPYLLSYSRFLTNRANATNQPFSLALLKNKNIGVATGSVFANQIQQMGVINPVIKEYPGEEESLEGLRNGDVDFILFDSPTALYWEANSAGEFKVEGDSYLYGFGLGIAINGTEGDLLKNINTALLQYQNSPDYKQNFNTYLQQF